MQDLSMRYFSRTCSMVSHARSGKQHCTVKANNVVSWFNILHKIMHKQGTMFHTLNILKTVVKQ